MSKKRAKSGAGSAGAARWEAGLLATQFEEDDWTSFVGAVVPDQLLDKEYAIHLCSSVSAKQRKLYSLVTYDGLIEEVQELGNPKGKKPKDVPAFVEICETAKTYLDGNELIPLPLLAKLVKWKLLAIKQEDQKRREAEQKETSGKESKEKKSGKKSARGKSAKGKGKKSPEIPSPKKESTLKKRGEEDEENKYIDDEPDDGPQHYVLLYGFLDAPLLVLLCELGIKVNCILRFTCEDYSLFAKRKAIKEEEEEEFQRPPEVVEAEQKAETKAKEELQKFWSQYEPLLMKASEGSSLHDIARITYVVKNDMVPEEYDDAENQVEFGTALFEDVACMIYDLLDKKRQFQNYKENMKLVQINPVMNQSEAHLATSGTAASLAAAASQPVVQSTTDVDGQVTPTPGQVDARYYNDLMDCIPAESCSVPLVMHCMLEQVVATEEGKEPPSAVLTRPRPDGLDHVIAAQIDDICAKFDLKETEKHNHDDSNAEKNQQFPVFYHHGDTSSERLRHLVKIDGFDPLKAEQSMLELLPVSMVTKFPRPPSSVIKQRSARLHELLFRCFKEGMDTAEMDHVLRKFVFESLVVRSTNDKGYVQRDESGQEVIWDDPYIGKKTNAPPNNAAQSPSDEISLPQDINRSVTPGGGILKSESKSRQGSAGSVRSSKSQVHFKDGIPAEKEPLEAKPAESNVSIPDRKLSPTPSLISVQDVADKPQRNLDEWCFVEHLKPHVLLQVLDEAHALCPFIDTYYHRKDHSLLVVMHNPTDSEKKNIISWDAKLHSDVGFRNYLEHVAEYIDDWTEKEESKYQQEMREKELAAELAAAQAAAASAANTPSASRPGSSKGRNRSQSPKKSRSKSPKGRGSESPAPSFNLDPNSGSFMRANSMKAWKVDHDRQLAEEARKNQEKEKKGRKSARSRSASPKKDEKEEKGKDKKEEGKKRGASGRGSRKGDKEKKDHAENEAKDTVEVEQASPEPERYYPFVGYNVGNNMIHANGTLTSLFPTDGGLVCCEKTEFISGDVFVRTTLLKDGHAVTVHILGPKDPEKDGETDLKAKGNNQPIELGTPGENATSEDTQEEATEKPLSNFGSLTASLSDGMVLSLSSYGKEGAPKFKEEKPQEEIEVPSVASPSPPPPMASPKGGRGGSGKKGKKGAPTMSIVAESEKASQKMSEPPKEEETKPPEPAPPKEPEAPPFQQLFISCPNGLHVSYMLETMAGVNPQSDGDPGKMLVKQCYPRKTPGKQPCEAPLQKPAMGEKCRYITKEGAVVKLMEDGSTEVLFHTGAISRGYPGSVVDGLVSPAHSRDGSPQRVGSSMSNQLGDKKGNVKTGGNKSGVAEGVDSSEGAASRVVPLEWVTTTVKGDRISTRAGDLPWQEGAVMLYTAKDPVTEEVMTTREDKVIIVERPDGTRIVDHSDGTRITSYTKNVEYRESNGEEEETGEMAPVKIRSLRQVKVECVGYATVIFNCDDSIATTIFGNGTQVIAIPDGSYEVLHHDGTRMTVTADGHMSFVPRSSEGDNGSSITPATYTLQHKDKVICEVKDGEGNSFTVNWKGEVTSEVRDHSERQEGGGGAGEGEREGETEKKTNECKETSEAETKHTAEKQELKELSHVPRYFVIQSDGSGFELLREKELGRYFHQMQMDPTTAFIQDPLPDHPEVQGLTVMRPYLDNVYDTWLMNLDEANIVPSNLRPRDFSQLPAKEVKKPGPKFGTNVGKALAIGSREDPARPPPAPQCPRYLQLRQFTQYRPLDDSMRKEMESCLDRHAKEVEEQERINSMRELKDPRSEEEKILAGDLLAQILAQDENQEAMAPDGSNKEPASFVKQIQTGMDQGPLPAKPVDVENPATSKVLYESATAPPPVPPPPKPHNKYTDDDWERVRLELKAEQENREALRKGEVPPYFESQWGKSFLAAQAAASLINPDMEMLSKKLAEGSKQGTQPPSNSLPSTPGNTPAPTQGGGDVGNAVVEDTDSPSSQPTKAPSLQTPREEESPSIQGLTASPSDVRPTNPTPGHADGVGTPTQVRPTNPTPARASQVQPMNRPGNPTPSTECDVASRTLPSDTPSSYASFPNHPSTIPEQAEEHEEGGGHIQGESENNLYNSEMTLPAMPSSETLIEEEKNEDKATKTPSSRRTPVRLPAAIQGQKPGALPNTRFQAIEEPVRRKVMTSSLAGRAVVGEAKVSANRGFELIPGEVFFGELREGCTYSMIIHLKNVGFDTCRYKVKQPPPATGLQVIYKPGPVAAGMKAELQIQLYAIAVGVEGESGRGSIGHHVEITTETDFIFLPVSAYILTAHEYDEQCRTNGRPYLSPGAHLLSKKPPSREGIIRPRKEQNQRGNSTQTATR